MLHSTGAVGGIFGTGALGDMGCHNMDLAFFALDLKNPIRIEGSGEGGTDHLLPRRPPSSGPFLAMSIAVLSR